MEGTVRVRVRVRFRIGVRVRVRVRVRTAMGGRVVVVSRVLKQTYFEANLLEQTYWSKPIEANLLEQT